MNVLTLLKSGRGGRWALQQLEQLVPLGVVSTVLVPEGPTAIAARAIAGLTVRPVRGPVEPGNREVLWHWRKEIRGAMRDLAPDVVHSHFVSTTIAARLALGRNDPLPVVFQVPGPLHLEAPATRQLDIRTARRRDRWIAGCQESARLLLRGGASADAVDVAYYAGDVGRWEALPGAPTVAEHLIPPDRVVVGMVAYTYPPRRRFRGRGLKGHEDFIAAVGMLLDRGLPVHAVLVGGPWHGAGDYHMLLRKLAADRLGVHHTWVDTVPDALPWYRVMDVAVHPSLSENLGGAAESMRAGVATIATNVGGFPDLVPDTTKGVLVPAKDPVALAQALEALVEDPAHRAQLAHAGRSHALNLLDPVRNAERVLAALERSVL